MPDPGAPQPLGPFQCHDARRRHRCGSARANLPPSFTYRHLLHPANLLQLVSPYLARTRVFGSPYPQEAVVYCGAVASIVPLWLLLRRRRSEFSRLANGALVLGTLAAVLALGEQGYLYRIQANVPLISRFQASARYIVLLHFALAVGAAVALRDLVEIGERRAPLTWNRLSLLALAPAASLLAAGAAAWLRARPQLLPGLASQLALAGPALAGAGLLLVAAALMAAGARGARQALPILILFAALDQGYYGLSFLRSQYRPASIEEFVSGQASPPDASAHRIESSNNILAMVGAHLADGYAAFAPARILHPLDGQRLRVASVKWVQTKVPWRSVESDAASLPNWDGRVQGKMTTRDGLGGVSVWAEVIDPMPRAWLVSRAIVSADPGRDIGSIDLESTALVPRALGLGGGQPGTVEITADEPGHIQLAATTSSRQLLILSESWHRGWEVRVDGRSAGRSRIRRLHGLRAGARPARRGVSLPTVELPRGNLGVSVWPLADVRGVRGGSTDRRPARLPSCSSTVARTDGLGLTVGGPGQGS